MIRLYSVTELEILNALETVTFDILCSHSNKILLLQFSSSELDTLEGLCFPEDNRSVIIYLEIYILLSMIWEGDPARVTEINTAGYL